MSKESLKGLFAISLPVLVLVLPLRLSPPLRPAAAVVPRTVSAGPFSAIACDKLAPAALASAPCNDPIEKCRKPIKYLGANGNCACFACEYGKSTQKNICTDNLKDKQTLLAETGQ